MRLRLILGTVLVLAGCVTTIAAHAKSDKLPIIDAHGHLNRDMSAERLIQLMDENGVKSMVLMARYYSLRAGGLGSDEQALKYAEKYPGRFIPFVAGQRPILLKGSVWSSHNPMLSFLTDAKAKARSGKFRGLGEFIMYHHSYTAHGQSGGWRDVDVPVDSWLMREIVRIGGEHDLPVLIHLEGEPDKQAAMIRMLEKTGEAKIIWAHSCGRMSARQISKMLTRFANLYCGLGGMTRAEAGGYGTYWPRYTRWIHPIENGNGSLVPEMRALYEDFPDRFLIGTDAAHTPALDRYQLRITRFRQLLSQLTPSTARKLAYENAEKIFGIK
jgi:Tat protein secretion system quality control protein TatD with DNase activity